MTNRAEQPPIIFLGVADGTSATNVGDAVVGLNIYGLRQVTVANIFPLDIRNLVLVCGLSKTFPGSGVLYFEDGSEVVLRLDILTHRHEGDKDVFGAWTVVGLSLRTDATPLILKPRELRVRFECDGRSWDLGELAFIYQRAPDLSEEQRRAIESNPALYSALEFGLACRQCGDGFATYVALSKDVVPANRKSDLKPIWHLDLADQFTCKCGSTSFPLRYLRESMQVLLLTSNEILPDGSRAISALSREDVERTLAEFLRLLDLEPEESRVQVFIEQNKVLLAPFAAHRLFFKPKILNRFVADFGIVNSQKELLLIEIERPGLRLLRNDGNKTAGLTHALEQPQEWDDVFQHHRAAVLEGIRNCPTDIARVSYLVIAGRSAPYDQTRLARLVRQSENPRFMTYDHLVGAVRDTLRATTRR